MKHILAGMVTHRYSRLLILSFPLALLAGCASTMGEVPAGDSPVSAQAASPAARSGWTGNTAVDAAILSGVSTMKAGESRQADGKTFIAGEVYFAASGLQCRPVTIVGNGKRLACNKAGQWFFAKDVFVTGADND